MQLQQLMSLGLGMTMPQFGNQTASFVQSPKPFSRDVPTEKQRRANIEYEESLLANAILNTEKAKRETQRGKKLQHGDIIVMALQSWHRSSFYKPSQIQ